MHRIGIAVFAAGLILAAGYLHGRIIDRWGDSHEMTQAVARLQTLKTSFGDWSSHAIELNFTPTGSGGSQWLYSTAICEQNNGSSCIGVDHLRQAWADLRAFPRCLLSRRWL